jgi:glycosyltransferase involved in cell wall biosynthesis
MHQIKQLASRMFPVGRWQLAEALANQRYQHWIQEVEPRDLAPVVDYSYAPLVSIVVPAYNTPDKYLEPLLDSVCAQTYPNWELVLVQASSDAARAEAIRRSARRDQRIKIVEVTENKGITGNTKIGVAVASGEYVATLDHDDTLAPFALNEVIAVLQARPEVDLFYSDEDKLSDDGRERSSPFFKPDWSPDMFLGVNYLTHFLVVRKTLVDKVGGYREDFNGGQDFDLFLRLLDHKPVIHHIPRISYHWRMAPGSTARDTKSKNYAHHAGRRALEDYLECNKVAADVVEIPNRPTNYRLRYHTLGDPKVSIIIPFKDKIELLQTLIRGILSRTSYPNYELILISNNSEEEATHAYLKTLTEEPRIQLHTYNHPFNWSALNNFGRRLAKGNILLFMHNDMDVLTPEWLEELVGVALQPAVGAVGGWLFYPGGRIQHAGVVLGMNSMAGHVFRGVRPGLFTLFTPFGLPHWPRNYLAVIGAGLTVKAQIFDQVGGFDERFIGAGSAVAFCLRLHQAGYRNVYWPFAHLTRAGSSLADAYDKHPTDDDLLFGYCHPYLESGDPYYNPNLDLMSEQPRIRSI